MDERTVTDADGRILSVRDLDPVEDLDLYELAGSANSTNPAWLGTAMRVCSVRKIEGHAQPFPKTKDQLKAFMVRLGRVGMNALRDDAQARMDADQKTEDEAAAKPLATTQAPALSDSDTLARN